MTARAWWQRARPVRGPLIVIVLYLIVAEAFAWVAGSDGLVTPDASVNGGLLVLGGLAIALRLAVIIAIPALVTYRLVSWLGRRIANRSAPPT